MTNWLENIGKGWRPFVMNAIIEIEDLGGHITCVKEKYGGLRIYYTTPIITSETYEKLNKIVQEAENKCEKICEECGKEGQLRSIGGWYKTRCEECVLS